MVVPFPNLLEMFILPSCNSVKYLAIESPNPVPGIFSAFELLKKLVKILSNSCFGIPMPLSLTSILK